MANISASEIAYEKAHIGESRQIDIAVSNGICLSIGFVAVLLRFISRRLAGTNNGPDDWWAWTALVRKAVSQKTLDITLTLVSFYLLSISLATATMFITGLVGI